MPLPSPQHLPVTGADSPSLIVPQGEQGCRHPTGIAPVGDGRRTVGSDLSLLNRVGRVMTDMAAAREVSDDEIKQHIRDCTLLMESAYDRFMASGNEQDREQAVGWMRRRDEAIRSLSPAYKAAREAQIQAAIAADHFIDQGDAARVRLAGGASE